MVSVSSGLFVFLDEFCGSMVGGGEAVGGGMDDDVESSLSSPLSSLLVNVRERNTAIKAAIHKNDMDHDI